MSDVTTAGIISYALAYRIRVTANQLARWRREGLLGPHRRPGRGRGHGRKVRYWAGAKWLAVYMARGLERKRDLRAVGWKAWLEGYPVTTFARKELLRILHEFEVEARETPAITPPKKQVSQFKSLILTWPLYRAFLLNLRREYEHYMHFEQAFGRTLPTHEYGSVVRKLEQPAEFLSADRMRHVIKSVSDAALERARDDILVAYGTFRSYMQKTAGITLRPIDASLIMMWLVLGHMAPDESEFFAKIIREGFVKAVREGFPADGDVPPQAVAGLAALRRARKEMRRARRQANLL